MAKRPVSKARVVIAAVVVEGRSQADVALDYKVSKGWVSKLGARYRAGVDGAFEPRSRRPHSSPNKTPDDTVELIVAIRDQLVATSHDAGANKIIWHVVHIHHLTVSRPTVNRLAVVAQLRLVARSSPSDLSIGPLGIPDDDAVPYDVERLARLLPVSDGQP